MAVFEASEGVIKCLPEAGSLKGSLEPENSQMTSDILQNTAVMSTLQVVDNSTKSLETTDNLLASRKPVMFRDVQSEKRVHAVESLYHSLKEASASQLLRASVAGKSAMKKPMRAGVSRSHEVGTSEAVSLKQALRSLTLAQASEMASLKRVSRTPGSAHLVDADAIKQRYRAVLDPQMLEPSSSKNLPRARDISYKKECVIPKVSEKAPEISHLSNGCSSSSLSVGETSLSSVATTSEEKSDNQSIGVVHLSENNKFNREAKDCLHQFENPDEVSSSTEFPYAVRTCSNGSGSSQVMEATESSDTGAVASSSNVGHGIRNAREYQPSTSKKMQKSKQRDCVEVSKSTASRGSTSSGVSDESCCSSLSSSGNRPHMSNDVRWEAIRAIRTKDGCLGLKHFRLLKRLGCGDIGNVYLTELIGTRCFFAMKVMDNESLASQKRMLRAQTEREILQMLDHPFLPTLYTHFETDRFSCLVMEFCPGGDLHILRQRQPGGFFPEQAARFYVAEVLLALEYLHMLGVVYRDLKPENVLVRDDGHIMLSDFDLSLRCADVNPTLIHTTPHDDDDDDDDDDEDADADAAAADTATAPKRTSTFCISPACADPVPSCFGPGRRRTRTRTRTRARTRARPRAVATATATATAVATVVAEPTGARSNSVVGTHEYLAPEIIRNEGHGSGVDWWTLGVLLYELLFGRTPFKGPNHAATLHNVAAAPLCFPPHHSSSSSSSASPSPNVSAAAKDLLRRLLAKDAVRRLGGRRGSADIKCHPFFHGLNWALIRCATPPHVPGPYYSSSPSPSSVM